MASMDNQNFSYKFVSLNETVDGVNKLNSKKASQVIDITVNPLSANFIKWSNALKQFVVKLPTNCLSVFDHFVGLALKGLKLVKKTKILYYFIFFIISAMPYQVALFDLH